MNSHRYILERSSKKYICPGPGCNQKKFTRYIDTTTGEHLADHVGICDRINHCGYHFTPKQHFNDNPGCQEQSGTRPQFDPIPVVIKPIGYLPKSLLENSVSQHEACNLFPFLVKKFRPKVATMVCEKYFIGTNQDGNTVFWQVDFKGQIRQAKIIQYNPSTGRRNKDTGAYFAGKKILNDNDANLCQCFFGEHLLSIPANNGRPVAIVESEKTAVIASIYYPQFIWLATGGKHGCKWTEKNVCNVLAGRNVILFPDLGAFNTWNEKAKLMAIVAGCKIVVSDELEKKANDEDRNAGLDIADYLLKVQDSSRLALTVDEYPVIWDLI